MSVQKRYVMLSGFVVGFILGMFIWTFPSEPHIDSSFDDESFIEKLSSYD